MKKKRLLSLLMALALCLSLLPAGALAEEDVPCVMDDNGQPACPNVGDTLNPEPPRAAAPGTRPSPRALRAAGGISPT